MKGYREFGTIANPVEPVETADGTIEWQEISELAEQGFRPY